MKRIAFILDQFELQSPGQQLLDRFVIGHNADGDFRKPEVQTTAHIRDNANVKLLAQRAENDGLRIAASLEAALKGIDALVLASGSKANSAPMPLAKVLNYAPSGSRVYIDHALVENFQGLEQLEKLARARSIALACSSAASHFFPLPAKPDFRPRSATQALIVAHGEPSRAEREALFALAPYLDFTGQGVPAIRKVQKAEVWNEAYSPEWRDLFASAVSRSNTIQGDPEKDGRTQDIVGLQLVERLAPEPRGWILRHEDGPEIFLLVLNGAVADFNFAVLTGRQIHSAQLFRAPAPLEDHYSGLAGWIEQFIHSTEPVDGLSPARYVLSAIGRMVQ